MAQFCKANELPTLAKSVGPVLAWLVQACGPDPCHEELPVGKRFEAELIEVRPDFVAIQPPERRSCGELDVWLGDILRFRVDGLADEVRPCRLVELGLETYASDFEPQEVVNMVEIRHRGTSPVTSLAIGVTFERCSGRVSVQLARSEDRDLFEAYDSNAPMLLGRVFQPFELDECTEFRRTFGWVDEQVSCGDVFGVELRER
jgi:hypothetical protein